MKKALIVVDVQYDFMPGGALAVSEGDQIVEPINNIKKLFDLVIYTQDWHPADHCSFTKNGGVWPVHCVQNTHGAQIDKRLLTGNDLVIQKGVHQEVDSYSGFWDNDRKYQTGLNQILKIHTIDTVYICGLATDYCVKFTALDAVDAGYKVCLLTDACRGVNVNPGDVDKALITMEENGIIMIKTFEL